MADTNLTGPLYQSRLGSNVVEHTWRCSNPTTASTALPMVFKASADKPLVVEAFAYIKTADTGTSPTFSAGTSSTATELLSAQATTATGFVSATAVSRTYAESDFQIYVKAGGTPSNSAVVDLHLRVTSVNLNSSTV